MIILMYSTCKDVRGEIITKFIQGDFPHKRAFIFITITSVTPLFMEIGMVP
ncbi:hypothetical protein KN1_12260 [Stygiolobus caldivivus]|uniref:Uncharacterized protein n=1 Tax=Stygiolobus caldivivus TaxID=2824673 RepID=A0A8D5ZHR2_9CREN|nr:hypothetical protein KN1_12260 [Stygiolobus caldivivus]